MEKRHSITSLEVNCWNGGYNLVNLRFSYLHDMRNTFLYIHEGLGVSALTLLEQCRPFAAAAPILCPYFINIRQVIGVPMLKDKAIYIDHRCYRGEKACSQRSDTSPLVGNLVLHELI